MVRTHFPILSRRAVVHTVGSGGVIGVAGLAAAERGDAYGEEIRLRPRHLATLRILAETVATFPIHAPYRTHGANDSPSAAAIRAASRRVSRKRLRGAIRAAEHLATVLRPRAPRQRALAVGRYMATASPRQRGDLKAAVAVALAAARPHYKPNSNHAADMWLDFCRQYVDRVD